MAGATITWTPSGGSLVTLGDDANKLTIRFGDASQECLVQDEPLAGGTNPYLKARGNVAGQFSFTATKSYASLDLMIAALLAELARCGQGGSLVLTRGSTTMTMAGAVLRSVSRAPESEGVKLSITYQFRIKGVA